MDLVATHVTAEPTDVVSTDFMSMLERYIDAASKQFEWKGLNEVGELAIAQPTVVIPPLRLFETRMVIDNSLTTPGNGNERSLRENGQQSVSLSILDDNAGSVNHCTKTLSVDPIANVDEIDGMNEMDEVDEMCTNGEMKTGGASYHAAMDAKSVGNIESGCESSRSTGSSASNHGRAMGNAEYAYTLSFPSPRLETTITTSLPSCTPTERKRRRERFLKVWNGWTDRVHLDPTVASPTDLGWRHKGGRFPTPPRGVNQRRLPLLQWVAGP